ncbi:6-phosphogluconolactonase [Homoserinibacter sp. YIM 151385]|uniref:6-phosphogluconolactonase n=1 Tax=Homoserinibacter sp. YIM 151385 TaxID=2985506 RepID=UPI0022F0861A|nr:6-phosphogluconolactonase [Homoserinibacter sp. YIM 151385]WBU38602.1 6-phosphogluconolactonase [Homoserinibacter sp. YIM 151385]
MTNERRVLVHPDKESLAGSVAARFITKIIDVIEEQGHAHVSLTGGTMGSAVLEAIAASPARESVDWSKITFWWSDERYLPHGDPERNDTQSKAALLDALGLEPDQVKTLPAPGEHRTIEEAALAAERMLAEAAPEGAPAPRFDVMFLGVGPDGHIASLFPEHAQVHETARVVVAEPDSPKPPAARLSLTLPVINAAERIWLVLAGADKAGALGLALAGASIGEVPAAGVQGRKRTVFFVDAAAAAEVPEALIAPNQYWTAAHDIPS